MNNKTPPPEEVNLTLDWQPLSSHKFKFISYKKHLEALAKAKREVAEEANEIFKLVGVGKENYDEIMNLHTKFTNKYLTPTKGDNE